jgi:hypothetical protein
MPRSSSGDSYRLASSPAKNLDPSGEPTPVAVS